MSHKIGEFDRQEGIKQAWHGLTHVRETIAVDDNWLTKWDVSKQTMFTGMRIKSQYCNAWILNIEINLHGLINAINDVSQRINCE